MADDSVAERPLGEWLRARDLSLAEHWDRLINHGYYGGGWRVERPLSLSPAQRRLSGLAQRAAHPVAYARRKWLGDRLARQYPELQLTNSYLAASIAGQGDPVRAVCERQIHLYEDFLARGDIALEEAGVSPVRYRGEMRGTLADPLKHVPVKYDREAMAALARFATQPQFLAAASRYLGVLPVLGATLILYSANRKKNLRRAQQFHIDPGGFRQIKMFMAVRPVSVAGGPLTFVPAHKTTPMLESGDTRYQARRVSDDAIREYCPETEWVRHTGDFGDAVFVDTSRCFHFGSRPSRDSRLLFSATYLDPFTPMFPIRDPLSTFSARWRGLPDDLCEHGEYVLSRKL